MCHLLIEQVSAFMDELFCSWIEFDSNLVGRVLMYYRTEWFIYSLNCQWLLLGPRCPTGHTDGVHQSNHVHGTYMQLRLSHPPTGGSVEGPTVTHGLPTFFAFAWALLSQRLLSLRHPLQPEHYSTRPPQFEPPRPELARSDLLNHYSASTTQASNHLLDLTSLGHTFPQPQWVTWPLKTLDHRKVPGSAQESPCNIHGTLHGR